MIMELPSTIAIALLTLVPIWLTHFRLPRLTSSRVLITAAHVIVPVAGIALAVFTHDPRSSGALAFWTGASWFGFAHLLPGLLIFIMEESEKSTRRHEPVGATRARVADAQARDRAQQPGRGSTGLQDNDRLAPGSAG